MEFDIKDCEFEIKECNRRTNPFMGSISIDYQILPKPGSKLWINLGGNCHEQIGSLRFTVTIYR